jgi:hypothetical protein
MITRNFIVTTLAMASLLAACDGNHVVGTYESGTAGTTGASGTTGMAGVTGSAGTTGAAGTGEAIGPLGPTQSWTGYIENNTKPGSDALKLTFATDAAGHAVGTITFGQGTPPPPATDPNVGYPPAYFVTGQPAYDTFSFVAEGYPYAFSGTLDGNRLRFKAPLRQLWTDWCALQTAYPNRTCLPGNDARTDPTQNKCENGNASTNQWTKVDCGKLWLCVSDRPCECEATSCQVSLLGVGESFDVSISGSIARGSVSGNFAGNVNFTKAP